jgi:hypothetical protein
MSFSQKASIAPEVGIDWRTRIGAYLTPIGWSCGMGRPTDDVSLPFARSRNGRFRESSISHLKRSDVPTYAVSRRFTCCLTRALADAMRALVPDPKRCAHRS